MQQKSAKPPSEQPPLMEIEGSSGSSLFVRVARYDGRIVLRLPEVVSATPADRATPPPPSFNHDRILASSHTPGAGGLWELAEDNGQLAYASRSRITETGECLEIGLTFINHTPNDWAQASAAPCVTPPPAFQDDGLWRTYVIDPHGRLSTLGDLVDHYNYNVISVRGGPRVGPSPGMDPQWRYHNLELADVVIMRQAADGEYTLVNAFERAGSIMTGFFGPCLHSNAAVEPVAPGQQKTVRGILALVQGGPREGLDFYSHWRESLADQTA